MNGRALSMISFVSCVLACAGDAPKTHETFEEACASIDGCETPENEVPGPREAIWRVLVVREPAGDFRIEAIDEVDVAMEIGRPEGPLSGEVGLAALDPDGVPLELQLLSFPTTLTMEAADAFSDHVELDLSAEETQTVGYLRVAAAVDSIAVVEGDGTVITAVAPPGPGEATGEIGSGSDALVQLSPTSACAHVVLIENAGDEHWFPRSLTSRGFVLRTPQPNQRASLASALGRMEPILCAGVNRVAFTDFPSGEGNTAGMVVGGFGGLVLINTAAEHDGDVIFDEPTLQTADGQAYFMHVFFHEAGHTLERLLDYTSGNGFEGIWQPSQRVLAAVTIDNVRLRGGFGKRWRELHESFVAEGWSGGYVGDDPAGRATVRPLGPAELADYGMISHYATKGYFDDIADTVAWPMSAPLLRAAGRSQGPPPGVNDYGCVAMRAHTGNSVPGALASVYAKLAFLRDLGAISQSTFDNCTGTGTTLPVPAEGFTIFEEGVEQRRFTNSTSAEIRAGEDGWVFEMMASGMAAFGDTEYPATLRLELAIASSDTIGPRVPWPRGLYSLATFEPNHFELRMPDAPAGNFNVYEGFVLVAEASNDRIVGSVVVQQAIRPDAPVPVPQTFDPPLQFRFRIDPTNGP